MSQKIKKLLNGFKIKTDHKTLFTESLTLSVMIVTQEITLSLNIKTQPKFIGNNMKAL